MFLEYTYLEIMRISSVSNQEYVNLVGHYNKLTVKPNIDPRLLSRGYSDEAIKMLQEQMQSKSKEIISLGLRFKGDLDCWEYPLFNYVMTLFDSYDRHGILPYNGCHSEQPSKIIELFQILDQLKNEHENRIREEQQREQKKQNAKRR